MNSPEELYMINEVALPSNVYGIQEQNTRKICPKCGKVINDGCTCGRRY